MSVLGGLAVGAATKTLPGAIVSGVFGCAGQCGLSVWRGQDDQ